ncbi:Inner membrane protein YpjD [BD1-7 clade bacterium]|uniref:Inner membrane protein YpjD n=1 Tax=BD1-7 clade bacterium TaxID=2029982 RepID=A0A5S9N6G7_9GAMM|nr:Inner membrane protein YpjD [BD1-7 clade bacterium]
MLTLSAIVTSTLYAISFLLLIQHLIRCTREGIRQTAPASFTATFALAVVAHCVSLHYTVFLGQALHLGFYRVSSLIFVVISAISLISQLRKLEIDNLIAIVIPLATLSVLVSSFVPSPTDKLVTSTGLIIHIVLSILSYSILTLAAVQAVLLAAQEQQLRQHSFNGLFRYLPPLMTMERLLFEMLLLGFILLTLGIGSGFLFIEDMFAQHLLHKTVLSIIAWCVFATLLIGHHRRGWRGITAAKWTLAGFFALMLAYFGSKFALEVILQKV